jgi:hypothetical protein
LGESVFTLGLFFFQTLELFLSTLLLFDSAFFLQFALTLGFFSGGFALDLLDAGLLLLSQTYSQ